MPSPIAAEDTALDIHLIAIGGSGMAPLACLLREIGHRVRGTDGPLYPPMSTLLQKAGIQPTEGFDARNLTPRPDLVIVGNAVPQTNPEAQETERLELRRLSMPQALAHFFLAHRKPLVVAGTHGKTTTTAIAAWVYRDCRRDPGFLIGGVPLDLGESFCLGQGERFLVEGDEYNAAYFDRGAKFLHYRAETLILTSAEYDHADLYATPQALLDAYRQVIAQLPADGRLIACGDTAEVRQLAQVAPCPVTLYGHSEHNHVRGVNLSTGGAANAGGSRFTILESDGSRFELELTLAGEHNMANALAVWAAARGDGIPTVDLQRALAKFRGVKRRMEELGSAGGVVVVDDFAHHPTAMQKTLDALAHRYPERRLLALVEPRSLTAGRRFLHDAYLQALQRADRVHLAPIFHAQRLDPEERLDLSLLSDQLRGTGTEALVFNDVEALIQQTLVEARPGDLIVTMSSGEFGRAPHRILAELQGKET